jgi:virulence-associated protein VapD
MLKKTLVSSCIGVALALTLVLLGLMFADYRNYPLTAEDITSEMAERDIVAFADIQGSRVYVTNEQEDYVAHMFEIASLTGRFRFLQQLNINEINRAIVLGQWHHHQVEISDDGGIAYYRFIGSTRIMNQRPYTTAIVVFIWLGLTASIMTYHTLFKNRKERKQAYR